MATRAHLYTLAGVCALPRALSPHREISPRSDMAALPQQGAAPLAPLRGYPCTPTKTVHPPLASVPFLRVLLSYPGGDTHSHLPLERRHCEPRKRQISRCRSRLGVCISIIGIVNIMGNISTIHSYNRRKVKEEDVPKYGRAVGTGTLIIGVSLIAAFVTTFWSEKAMYFIVIPALVIGLGFILYAQFKYNKGIF